MKRMIIIGACLITAAIVYGFVDYLKTDKKQLQRMYGDEPAASPASTGSRLALPSLPIVKPAEIPPVDLVTIEQPDAPATIPSKKSRHKKLNFKLYSRAALEEKYIPADTAASTEPVSVHVPEIKRPDAPAVGVIKTSLAKSPSISVPKRLDYRLFSRAPLKRTAVAADTAAGMTTVMQVKN